MQDMLTVFILLIGMVLSARADLADVPPSAWSVCTSSAVCRAAYGLYHETPDPHTRLTSQMREVGLDMAGMASMNRSDLLASHMALARLAFGESRCAPSEYERYDATTNTMRCQCYLDRDCSVAARPVAADTASPVLVALFSVTAILVLGLFISSVVNTRRELQKK